MNGLLILLTASVAMAGLASAGVGAEKKLEIDPDQVMHKLVGRHVTLRPMKVEDGKLYYKEGTEVAVYGVN